MAIKTIEELKEEISSLPEQYKKALEKQTQKILEVEKLERDISKLKRTLSLENETETNEDFDDTDDIELIDLETSLEKLKLKLAQTEYQVELNARKTTEKVTESHVKALIGTNEEVYKLKEQFIDEQAKLKTKKAELKRQSKERWEKERLSRRHTKNTPDSDELDNLETQLFITKLEQFSANDGVEVLKIKLETYRLLVGVESLEEME